MNNDESDNNVNGISPERNASFGCRGVNNQALIFVNLRPIVIKERKEITSTEEGNGIKKITSNCGNATYSVSRQKRLQKKNGFVLA